MLGCCSESKCFIRRINFIYNSKFIERNILIMKSKMKIASVVTGLLSFNVQAEFLSDNSINSPLVLNFNTVQAVINLQAALQIGGSLNMDITVEPVTSTTNGLITHFDGWNLLSNGSWQDPQTYVAINGATDGLWFSFNDAPVSSVGGVINYARSSVISDVVITAYDVNFNVLETHDVVALADIVTPGEVNQGGFRGIKRPTSDIAHFLVTGPAVALDDLTFKSVIFENGFE